ncbi:MAG: hypothetical protein ACXVPQ_02805 [Bacteroidia bacterium]
MAKIHIGKKIKEVWKESRLKGTEFAALINRDRQVIYDIFDRETIDTGLLHTISKVLHHDFFSYYALSPLPEAKEAKNPYGYATKEEVLEIARAVQMLTREMEKLRLDISARPVRKYAKKK